jgi:hypothetical protein
MNEDLKPGEPHPSAFTALDYIRTIPPDELAGIQEAFSSCAIEGNRLAEICSGTLSRLLNKQPVSDRYMMGLVLAILNIRRGYLELSKTVKMT